MHIPFLRKSSAFVSSAVGMLVGGAVVMALYYLAFDYSGMQFARVRINFNGCRLEICSGRTKCYPSISSAVFS